MKSIDANSLSAAQALQRTRTATTGLADSAKQAETAGQRLVDALRDQVALYGKGVEDMLRYRAAQAGVAEQAAPLILQLQNQRAAQEASAAAALKEALAQREAAQAKQSLAKSQDSFIQSLKEQADTAGKSATEILQYKAAQLGVSESAAQYITRLAAVGKQQSSLTDSTKLTAYQTQQLSFQLNDLFVQIASGQSPITALIQQGSQLSGTFGGVRGALTAVGTLITPVTATLGTLAATLGVAGYAYYKGSQEADEFRKTLILTGNAAGTSAVKLSFMAAAVAANGAGTQARAADVLNQMARSGVIASQSLQSFTEAALRMETVGGDAAEDTVKAFEQLGKTPLESARQLDQLTNAFSRSTLEQIRNLTEQGRTTEAGKLAQQAYADTLNQRTPQILQNLGYVERAWRAIKGGTKAAGDAIADIGRPEDEIAQLQAKLAKIDAQRAKAANGLKGRTVLPQDDVAARQEAADRERLRILTVTRDQEAALAAATAKTTQEKRLGQEWDDKNVQYLTAAKQLQRDLIAIQNEGVAAGISQEKIDERKAARQRQYDSNGSIAKQIAQIADLTRAENSRLSVFEASEAILEANRQAGIVGDKEYYGAKLAFINLTIDAQKRLLEASIADQQQQLLLPNVLPSEAKGIESRIKDLRQQITDLTTQGAVKGINLATEQTAAQAMVSRAFEQSRQSAADYLATLARAAQRENSYAGLGDAARQQAQGRDAILDKYADERRQLENERALMEKTIRSVTGNPDAKISDEAQKDYERRVDLSKKTEAEELRIYNQGVDDKLAADSRWENGASKAMANYLADAQNTAKLTEDLYTKTFSSLEDSIVSFVTTGKFNFKSLADTIISEIVRIQVKQSLSSLFGTASGSGTNWLGIAGSVASIFGGTGTGTSLGDSIAGSLSTQFGGMRAIGGPVSASSIYRINEKGLPEVASFGGRDYLLTGGQSGTVKPAGAGGDGPITIINHTSAAIGRATQQTTSNGGRTITLEEFDGMFATAMADPNSRASRSMGKFTKTERKR
ncbi:phage tail length tape measure family protein [Paucibacter sp. R3-3]|uniref:Phage tail length tape measure family protein n=1 Tax=Roseateles agri TaxID=3098619 RepID=A0ABU5DJV1_9BURK|nr:phage tail length tape measure family protein [Paucibacter sp. R3-3]MDY0746567.1 phage tail length tape measure family protein [Paucibacter sp. R3-3]